MDTKLRFNKLIFIDTHHFFAISTEFRRIFNKLDDSAEYWYNYTLLSNFWILMNVHVPCIFLFSFQWQMRNITLIYILRRRIRKLFKLVSCPFEFVLYNNYVQFRFITSKACATFFISAIIYSFKKHRSRPKQHTCTQYSKISYFFHYSLNNDHISHCYIRKLVINDKHWRLWSLLLTTNKRGNIPPLFWIHE